MSSTPKTLNELVEQLIQYENEIRQLKKKNKALDQVQERARKQAVSMHTKSSKKSSFTNYEVRQMSKDILAALEKPPLLK